MLFALAYAPMLVSVAWFGWRNGVAGILLALLVSACLTAALVAVFHWEIRRRKIELDYRMETAAQEAFKHILNAVNEFAASSFLWRVTTERSVTEQVERKRQAGATSLVGRHVVAVGIGTPKWLTSNIPLPCIQRPGQWLYFLPDGLVVEDASGVAHVPYNDLHLGADSERFIEDARAPQDAIVEGFTWLHPNRDGTPDARFSNNRQLPICRYGIVRITSRDGLNLYLQTSRLAAAGAFVDELCSARDADADLSSCIVIDESFSESAGQGIKRFGQAMLIAVDELFRTVAGRDNDLIYRFLWVLLATWLVIAVAAIVWAAAKG